MLTAKGTTLDCIGAIVRITGLFEVDVQALQSLTWLNTSLFGNVEQEMSTQIRLELANESVGNEQQGVQMRTEKMEELWAPRSQGPLG